MKVSYYHLVMPMKVPFTTSFGSSTDKDVLVFELENDGIKAYSECTTNENPFYGPEDNGTALHIIKDYLIKEVKLLPEPKEFMDLVSNVKGNNMAKAAMEMLLYDYHAKKNKKTLIQYMDRRSRGYANVGVSIGMDRIELTLNRIQEAIDRKYKRIKVKIKKGKEMEILSAVRDHFPHIPLSVDANSDYSEKDFDTLKQLDRFDLEYIEQPLYHDDIYFHSKLARQIGTPLCLDESIVSPELAKTAMEMNACSIINIKPGRVGGLYNSLKIAEIVREFEGHCWVGGMLETGIGRSHNMSLASLELVDYPGDTSPNDKYFEKDVVDNPFFMKDGTITPNNEEGIGVHVNMERMKMYETEQGSLL